MKVFKYLLRLVYILSKVPLVKIFKYNDSNADYILWIPPLRINNLREYLSNGVLNELGWIRAFISHGLKFRIVFSGKIGKVSNKKIIYSHSYTYNTYGLYNHSVILNTVVRELEQQSNTLFPSLNETLYWENKVFMHEQFGKLQIRTPETYVIDVDDIRNSLPYPFIIKEVHSSASAGVYKIQDDQMYLNKIEELKARGVKFFLVQEILNMRKDLRVTIIGQEIVLHYWRINLSDEWKPTSTGRGSSVDFVSFPEQWRSYIMANFDKLGIRSGAFDIAWQNDDLDSEPYFLEVSPAYKPNPPLPEKYKSMTYSSYKKIIGGKDAYYKKYVDLMLDLKGKLFETYFLNS